MQVPFPTTISKATLLVLLLTAFVCNVQGFVTSRAVPTKHVAYSHLPSGIKSDTIMMSAEKEQGFNIFDVEATKRWVAAAALGLSLVGGVAFPPPSLATDAVATGKCLLSNCPKQLAKCLGNPACAANIVCLNRCNNRPDETECQIKCGDTFDNEVIAEFNSCAVSQKKCVLQRQDDGAYPIPSNDVLVPKFSTKDFNGRWYISAGLNKLFDCFDCQVHFFEAPTPTDMVAKINWRITEPDGEVFSKSVVQTFVQDPEVPGILYNHDNEFLHYQDDWYIVDMEPNEFIYVYYRGSNDAWDGYGGAVVYTTQPSLDPKYVPRMVAASKAVGKDWADFTLTDNSCPATPTESATVLRAEYAKKQLILKEKSLQEQLTAARYSTASTIEKEEKELLKAVEKLENQLLDYQVEAAKKLVGLEQEIVKDVVGLEKEIVKDVVGLEQEIVKDVVGLEQEIVKDVVGLEKEIEKDVKKVFSPFWKK